MSLKRIPFSLRVIIVAALVMVALGAFSTSRSAAADAGLFGEAATPEGYDAAQTPAYVLRERFVSVNFDQLGDLSSSPAQTVTFNLFADAVFTATLTSAPEAPAGGQMWLGTLDGIASGDVVMAVNNGSVYATVKMLGGHYRIESVGGRHVIREINEAAFVDHAPTIREEDITRSASAEEIAAAADVPMADTSGIIDVMVLYTPAALLNGAANNVTNMNNLISTAITESNQAYSNSMIYPRMRLVHAAQITYTETTSCGSDAFSCALNHLTNTDGVIDDAHTLRNTYGADVVALLIHDSAYCGLAWRPSTVSSANSGLGFSITAWSCATGYYSFSHEIGHNQGANHDWFVSSDTVPAIYAHGYYRWTGSVGSSWRTVLAYGNGCSGCTRIKWFSNPGVNYPVDSQSMGVSGTTNGTAADNHRQLNESANAIANYRAQVVPLNYDAPVDYNGNGTSEVPIFRGGAWLFYNYSDGSLLTSIWTGQGGATSRPTLMDYDGDGSDEMTVYLNGAWHFFNDNGTYNKGVWTGNVAGDRPVPADYDGNGVDDPVIFRNGAWVFYDFTTGLWDSARSVWTGNGAGGTAYPAPMDFDGDGTADFTIYTTAGAWHFFNDNGTYVKGIWTGFTNGIPVPGNYNGSGADDVVLFQNGAWQWYDYASGTYNAGLSAYTGYPPHKYGGTSVPAPLDYNGDGTLDKTMYAGGPWWFYDYGGAFVKNVATGGVAGDMDLSARPAQP